MNKRYLSRPFIVYPFDNTKADLFLLLHKIGFWVIFFGIFIFIIRIFLPKGFPYSYLDILWIVAIFGGAFIYTFLQLNGILSVYNPLQVTVQDGRIKFLNMKTQHLQFEFIPQQGFSISKKFLGDGRGGQHLLIINKPGDEPLTFLFRVREFRVVRELHPRGPFEKFQEDLEKIGVHITE